MVNPASRQMSTNLVASSTPFVPHALKNSFPPPNVPVPKVRTGTLKPELPKNLYSIRGIYRFLRGLQACDRLRSQAQALRDIQHGCSGLSLFNRPGTPKLGNLRNSRLWGLSQHN